MHIPEKYLKIAKISLISLLAIILIAGGIAYAKREALLNAAIKRVINIT
jgi:ABC-type Co2+ transport system permease subunit